jgi:histidine ammonia-lyase
MTVTLTTRSDITLEAVRRVAWRGENVRVAPEALERIAKCRRTFMKLIDSDPDLMVYGVTSGYGESASRRLTPEERKAQAARPPRAGASFGEPLPERIVRAIVLARLANFLEGHAAVRPELAQAVAAMLDGEPLPPVPRRGNGGAGEILALGHLFADLGERVGTEEKESLALINGSPCAAALVADATLAARNRLRLAHQVFGVSTEAILAPLEAYAPELEELWDDEYETAALKEMRALLEGGETERRPYQSPVSYRILPRVLGQMHRTLDAAERAAETSLRSVSDNPVYIPPDREHPLGRVRSTGGYHNGQAPPALDGLSSTWADLCQLAERHTERIVNEGLLTRPGSEGYVGVLLMVIVGYAEEARLAAQPTILPRGGYPQNDVVAPVFLAWQKESVAGSCLDACLAILAAVSSQALYASDRAAPPPLESFLAEIRQSFPPVDESRTLGPDAERLAAAFGKRVFSAS